MSGRRQNQQATRANSPHPIAPIPERFALDVPSAVAYSSVNERRIRQAVAAGELAIVRHGGGEERDRFVILRSDLERWLLSLRRPALQDQP